MTNSNSPEPPWHLIRMILDCARRKGHPLTWLQAREIAIEVNAFVANDNYWLVKK